MTVACDSLTSTSYLIASSSQVTSRTRLTDHEDLKHAAVANGYSHISISAGRNADATSNLLPSFVCQILRSKLQIIIAAFVLEIKSTEFRNAVYLHVVLGGVHISSPGERFDPRVTNGAGEVNYDAQPLRWLKGTG
jgi:hypothetical protein